MARRAGVGIWKHYRTTDRADGLQYHGIIDGMPVHAKLYWAPADWRNPDDCGKRPYVVIMFSPDCKMDRYGRHEDEIRIASHIGDERKRRNWNALCEVAQKIDEPTMARWMRGQLNIHELYLNEGCTFMNGTMYYPQGANPREVNERVQKAHDEWARKEMVA